MKGMSGMHKVLYFGCIRETGHYLWDVKGHRLHHESHPDMPKNFPTKISALDGGLMPVGTTYAPEGRAYLAHVNGWTIISFNDSSVDKRPGSHSVFIVEGVHIFDLAIHHARKTFPSIFDRFKFKVEPATIETPT